MEYLIDPDTSKRFMEPRPNRRVETYQDLPAKAFNNLLQWSHVLTDVENTLFSLFLTNTWNAGFNGATS